jgi:cyanophycinase-like exopeptidase
MNAALSVARPTATRAYSTARPGPVALLGGHEHREGTEAIERTLLDHLGVAAPRVTVLAVASSARQVGMVAALARNYWTRLGATVRIAMPDTNGSRDALDAVADADAIVLTGGVPNRLVAALGASPVWDLALERWRAGAAISASSAGAMSLFAWRLRLYPPHPLALIPGLGPFDGWVAAPHFSRFRAERWATRVTHRFGGLGVLGIDEATATIGRNGRYTVVGNGNLTIVKDGRMTVHHPNADVDLDLHDSVRELASPLIPLIAA